jgi:hypothetical protein
MTFYYTQHKVVFGIETELINEKLKMKNEKYSLREPIFHFSLFKERH